ncbi:unnamed protein product [Leptidea sinapis]|uniref:Spatacsin C-terminal domain-containing protein n=1 Tax=Leptidea sinapis TaxID=189913 RepID=A0A5E4QGZ1_9NEOP|nr:unnamed protein product [Leptidea sinapis]
MDGLTQNEKIIWNSWEQKSARDVVREAAAKGTHINLAIKYLIYKNSWNETVAKDWFIAEVKSWTVQLLMRKQIFKVLHLLNKVDINPEDHLMTLAQTATEIEYRDFLVEHLQKITKDMKSENIARWENFLRHWNLLRYLEKSFEVEGKFKQNKVFGTGTDRVFVNESEIKELTIEKIEKYSSDWKSNVATALFFDVFEFSLLEFTSATKAWTFLIQNNKAMVLVRWINVQMSEVVRDMNTRYSFFSNENFERKLLNVDAKGLSGSLLENLDVIFRKWSITNEMIEYVANSNCFSYTKMCVYDTLSSYGIIIENEKRNLNQIIERLSRTQTLKIVDDVFNESCATITIQDFYLELAKYFVTHKLYKALTVCIDSQVLNTDLSAVEGDAKNCIELWLLFKSIEQTSDRQSHVVPVYKTCQQIAKDDIDNYISSNALLFIGMILLEDNASLFDIFLKEGVLEFKDVKLLNKGYKQKLPHMYNVYKKFSDTNNRYECRDVNVYQLLSGYRGLDISKIFEFQLMNKNSNISSDKSDRRSLGSLLLNDVDISEMKSLAQRSIEMPDFANDKLMKKYGYDAKLNHMYYLRQYRPCNASQAFVTQQYQLYNRMQDKGIKSACCEAHALALQNWSDPSMTACAISFVAMIGCNPTRCRVHISAATAIKKYLVKHKGYIEVEATREVTELMLNLVQGHDDTAKCILKYLEEIMVQKFREMRDGDDKNVDMSFVLYESQAMVKFAILHNLPLPEMVLQEIVKENSWFNFLLFGDVFRYPLNQMLNLSQGFSNRAYAEHLKHIMLHKTTEDDNNHRQTTTNGQRRIMRLSSTDTSPSHNVAFEFPSNSYMGRELWEVAAACHGPEDPPAALLRAAEHYREPLLESPLATLTLLLYRSIRLLTFDKETVKQLESFLRQCQRKYSTDSNGFPWDLSPKSLQKISVDLIKVALSHNFDSAYHQKEFLKCLAEVDFGKGFVAGCPDFSVLYDIVNISMETPNVINVSKLLEDESGTYVLECIDLYKNNANYDVAIRIAKLSGLPVDEILITEWSRKAETLFDETDDEKQLTDVDIVKFIAECSEVFKNAGVTTKEATAFLKKLPSKLSENEQKFYAYRIIMSWFDEGHEYGAIREETEHNMWEAYFTCDNLEVFLDNYDSTLHFSLNGQKTASESKKLGMISCERPFAMTLHEIEVESDVGNIENAVILDDEDVPVWRRTVNRLLELRLVVEAFRLAKLYKISDEYLCRTPCPVEVTRTCLRLAEAATVSETSVASFEELVVIQERQDEGSHLAAREDADRLTTLDALSVKTGLAIVANYYRIALQIGWDYMSVLKYQNRALDFISLVSGKSRMSLANLVFRTFNIPSKQIADYLCREMVSAIISPHLVKTSTFRQKEHFQYTLWGYVLDSDIEMFLNMRPDACSHIGRLILDHLIAFQKIYKATAVIKIPENIMDDSCFDVETLIDEEYQNLDGEEIESILTEEGTLNSAETESMYSVSTVYTAGKMSRETRRNLFDVISKSNVHIRNEALAGRLLTAKSWRLMVRLLTGLARYTECGYILQNKIAEFKHGLLDFLKKHCPGDTDTYIMVALHFNMYAEAANVKRKQALDLINDLEKMATDGVKSTSKKPVWPQIHDNVPTRTLLETAMNHCCDAAELYLQGGCMGSAGDMAAQAQLIALQISLLNASPTRLILKRTTEQM